MATVVITFFLIGFYEYKMDADFDETPRYIYLTCANFIGLVAVVISQCIFGNQNGVVDRRFRATDACAPSVAFQ